MNTLLLFPARNVTGRAKCCIDPQGGTRRNQLIALIAQQSLNSITSDDRMLDKLEHHYTINRGAPPRNCA